MKKDRRLTAFITACLAPALLLFSVFVIYPTITIFRMALYKWGGISAKKTFVGFDNFLILAKDANFIRAAQNTIFLLIFTTIITIVLALLFAAIVTKEDIKGQNFFRVVFYIPNILSIVVISGIFSAIYDPAQGLANSLIGMVKPGTWENIQFLGNSKIVIPAIAGAMIWQAIGYYMVMYMASMSSIPEALYEAAEIEGASKFKQFFDITLPLIWDTIRTTLTFFIVSNINLSFLFVKVMTSGGPNGASEVFLSYMYKQAYNNSSYGYGMAIGATIFIFSFALSAIINRVTKREPLQF